MRILLLEDDFSQSMRLCRLFHKTGSSVVNALDLQVAGVCLAALPFDLIVINAGLVGEAGLAIERLSILAPAVPIVIVCRSDVELNLSWNVRARVFCRLPWRPTYTDVMDVCASSAVMGLV